jgi:hypothetical protein
MTAVTFAYQLGETFGVEDASEALKDGSYGACDAEEAASQLAAANYPAEGDPSHDEFVSGYLTGWARMGEFPPFLVHAPLLTPVIVNEDTLQRALETVLPNVNILGFHHELARQVLAHITNN